MALPTVPPSLPTSPSFGDLLEIRRCCHSSTLTSWAPNWGVGCTGVSALGCSVLELADVSLLPSVPVCRAFGCASSTSHCLQLEARPAGLLNSSKSARCQRRSGTFYLLETRSLLGLALARRATRDWMPPVQEMNQPPCFVTGPCSRASTPSNHLPDRLEAPGGGRASNTRSTSAACHLAPLRATSRHLAPMHTPVRAPRRAISAPLVAGARRT